MEFFKLVSERYSVRSFSEKRIEDEKLNAILKAAQVAPTACNNQPQRMYVLQSAEAIEKLKGVTKFVFGASTVILFTSKVTEEWKNPFSQEYHTGDIDVSIVCTHAMLQAWELGIGSCWVDISTPKRCERLSIFPPTKRLLRCCLWGIPPPTPSPRAGIL